MTEAPPPTTGDQQGSTAATDTGQAQQQPSSGEDTQENPLKRTRVSQAWIGIIFFALVLILLLIFILENTQKVNITYFGATGSIPVAVALLLAAVAGILLAAIAGTLRILQLRRRVRKDRKARARAR